MPEAGSSATLRDGEVAVPAWPGNDFSIIPDWVYTSETVYARELGRIFRGRTWNFVALEAEIPNTGDFRRSTVGDMPVVVARGAGGEVHVFQNRCAHRGAEFCRENRGHVSAFICPYHKWTYDHSGALVGVPFRRGIQGKGGMPADFRLEDHATRRLSVTRRGGVVFASFATDMEPLDTYLGATILRDFDVVFSRPLKILGYYRNTLPGNWKLYHENLKDPYHATLLHTYLVSFDLMVAGQKSAMIADDTGLHGTMASARGDQDAVAKQESKKEMRAAFRENLKLNDDRILSFEREFDSPWSVTMQTIWPNLIVQRELNTLGVRQIVPKGPHEIEMHWVMFGYADDSEEMTRHRLRQGNLMGPAGFLGIDDNEAITFVQQGLGASLGQSGIVKLGEDGVKNPDHLLTESAIRDMYRSYARVMGLAP
jgi:anthranilate 1,2-dioxygenase large subunit